MRENFFLHNSLYEFILCSNLQQLIIDFISTQKFSDFRILISVVFVNYLVDPLLLLSVEVLICMYLFLIKMSLNNIDFVY